MINNNGPSIEPWEWTEAKNNQPLDIPGGILGGFRGSQNAKVWKIYQTAGPIGTKFGKHLQIHLGMDIYAKNHRYPRVNCGGFRGSKMQKSGKSTKRLDRLAQIWYTSADSSLEWT